MTRADGHARDPQPIAVTGRSLADLAKLIGERGLPPVDRWNPDHCGNSDMRIAADGSWYHMGTRIDRPAMEIGRAHV